MPFSIVDIIVPDALDPHNGTRSSAAMILTSWYVNHADPDLSGECIVTNCINVNSCGFMMPMGVKIVTTDSSTGLSPVWSPAIIWTSADILPIGCAGWEFTQGGNKLPWNFICMAEFRFSEILSVWHSHLLSFLHHCKYCNSFPRTPFYDIQGSFCVCAQPIFSH